ncbi:probable NHX1 - Na+/H+ exchanger of the prevacuolar compartment - involved in salt tolerance [Melanopsichium pennsylvanicum]|uniref:Sodium/hydrogen exchanger n=2 Tax=Melanopsichium pennsylvanicum TaxID=63383 RepID=A0AAJ4XNS9_9BASI|nr:probable NHX1-Na /H exchanger of the prevacuolar compartment-involved in salt tolerance [Melanopsichium pennsylvanicum 4]SNX85181.1 probable NHX1 - Na+/H+ exchanger of the prevacuolar compartment - involved in salt tolerance [Melanopsichium pennsylvanicum]
MAVTILARAIALTMISAVTTVAAAAELTVTTTTLSSSTATATATATPKPAMPVPDAEQQERFSSLALFLVLTLLILSFWTSYYLKVKRITAVHETIVGLFAGMFVGVCLRIGPGEQVQNMLSFSNTIMLNVLLPPIILASGYDLRQENFFRNFGTILIFAFAGTFISAIVVGVIVYLWSLLHLESISLTLLECLIFGSTLSATDPVTILAIFNTYKVDPKLYSVIFGESILNDAVSIVMFDTLSTFRGKEIYLTSIFHGIGLFLVVFTLSMLLGVCFGLGCSLLLKHSRLSSYPQLESCLVALIAYTSYFFSNGVTMSGIVSLLFCGITLKHYAYHNMSRRTQRTTRYTFQTLASLSENFIFIYLGLSLFTQEILVYKPLFIIVTVFAVVASRYCAVFPIASVVNAVKRARNNRRARATGGGGVPRGTVEEELPRQYQIMLFWAGLRGAVGFALSAGIEGQNAIALQTTVLVTVVLTVIVFGGTTAQMLEILGIRTGVQDDEGDSDDDEEDEDDAMRLRGMQRRTYLGSDNYRDPSERAGLTRGRFAANTKSGYRDASETSSPRASLSHSSSVYGRGGSKAGGGVRGGFADDLDEDDEVSRYSSELLPSRSSTPGLSSGLNPLTAGASISRLNTPGLSSARSPTSSSATNGVGLPSLSEIRKAITEASSSDGTTSSPAKQLLDQAGLVMKDGQWFQAIDQKYLLPLFSNSVASRKHEEKKIARIAARDAAASQLDLSNPADTSSASGVGAGRRNFFSVQEDGDHDLYPAERDAVIVDEDEDEDGTTPVFDATSFASATRRSTNGANTPTRRTFSHDNDSQAL